MRTHRDPHVSFFESAVVFAAAHKDPAPQKITERILKAAAPGGILLFHLGKRNTADALENIILKLTEQGYSFCTVSEMLLGDGAYVDADGIQRTAAE